MDAIALGTLVSENRQRIVRERYVPPYPQMVLAMSVWSVKTRRAPSRHCRDTGVYGHTNTAMHDNECTPPPLSRTGSF